MAKTGEKEPRKKEKMKVVFLNAEKRIETVENIKPELETYYKMINCRLITIVNREIGGKRFDIIADDEGLFCENPIFSAVNSKLEPMLVGNLIICNHDEEGNETDLTDEDVEIILNEIITLKNNLNYYYRVVSIEY